MQPQGDQRSSPRGLRRNSHRPLHVLRVSWRFCISRVPGVVAMCQNTDDFLRQMSAEDMAGSMLLLLS